MAGKPYMVGAVIGAAVGSAVGYLYFTDEGRRRREDLGHLLDRAVVEMHEARGLWQRLLAIGEQYQHARREALDSGAASLFGFGQDQSS
ncbi:MAG: YtxH domain-containing protein [Vicinamibacterales bacterium]